MLKTRIIPCLDVHEGRVVKGVNFVDLIDAGDPVEQAKFYCDQGADELCFLDITATHENRGTILDVVRRTAEQVFISLTVGGGVREMADIRALLEAGADKVAINSAAVANPDFVREASDKCGRQCIVVAIDAKRVQADSNHGSDSILHNQILGDEALREKVSGGEVLEIQNNITANTSKNVRYVKLNKEKERAPSDMDHSDKNTDLKSLRWEVYTHGGRKPAGLDVIEWAQKMVEYGAGELLLTSMDRDGTKAGFDLELTRAVSDAVTVPVIASGGVGTLEHLSEGVRDGGASAVLAASIFHFGTYSIAEAKAAMRQAGLAVRL